MSTIWAESRWELTFHSKRGPALRPNPKKNKLRSLVSFQDLGNFFVVLVVVGGGGGFQIFAKAVALLHISMLFS